MRYYPAADRSVQWFGDDYAGVSISPDKVVIHCTEGTGWPGYSGGASAPHLTCKVGDDGRLDWRQHFPLDRSARALRNPAGGVQTNHDHAIQIEIVGTCDRAAAFRAKTLRMWELPDGVVDDLGAFLWWCHVEFGIPLTAPTTWPRYPNNDSARLTGKQWTAFTGTCGHLHVPENTHQDPGDFPIKQVLEAARMATTREIAQGVWNCDTIPNVDGNNDPINPDNPLVQADYALGLTLKHARTGREVAEDARNRVMGLEVSVGQVEHRCGFISEDVKALQAAVARLEAALAELLNRVAG